MTFKEQVAFLRWLDLYDSVECADTMESMKARIKELESGACRFNCRKRKESCQSFAYYMWKNWKSRMIPPAKALDDMYDTWKKDEQI